MSSSSSSRVSAPGGRSDGIGAAGGDDPDWQRHPSVNVPDACPYCGAAALHAQHCKRMCLACGWFRSCVD